MEDNSPTDLMPKDDVQLCSSRERPDNEIVERQKLEGVVNGAEVETPKAGMIFSSEEEVRRYYKSYAQNHGFGITKISTKNDDDGMLKYYSLACSRAGKRVSTAKNSFNPRPSTKSECKAKINVVVRNDGKFVISRVYLDHNHDLSPGKSRHFKGNKVLNSHAKRTLDFNDQDGRKLSKIYGSIVTESADYEHVSFGEKDRARKLRLGVGDAEAIRDYFVRMHKRNPNFFHEIDFDEEDRLKNAFWADARSRATYNSFCDVISFDTTYLTNKYDMPLVFFVGVNHHGQAVLLGCGLLSNEDTKTYIWLFKSWLKCMSGRRPNAIVTDKCKAIQAAVAEVFPESLHRLCLCHIMRKLPEKLGGLPQYKPIKRYLKTIVYESLTTYAFEESWGKLIRDYNLEKNDWLNSLFVDRYRWVPVFVRETFWAGMSTTQQSESMDAFFDEHVHSKTSLKEFVEQYDHALKRKVENESTADFASRNSSIPVITDFYFEKQYQEAYTNDIFKKFQDEIRGMIYCNVVIVQSDGQISTFQVTDIVKGKDGKSRKVVYDVYHNEFEFEVKCLCHLLEYRGILCRHIAKVLLEKNVMEIPSHYILERWRKDIKRKHNDVKNCYDDLETTMEQSRYDKLYAQFYQVVEIGAESEHKFEILKNCLEEVHEKLIKSDPVCVTSHEN